MGDPFEAGITLTRLAVEMFDQRSSYAPIVFLETGNKADGFDR